MALAEPKRPTDGSMRAVLRGVELDHCAAPATKHLPIEVAAGAVKKRTRAPPKVSHGGPSADRVFRSDTRAGVAPGPSKRPTVTARSALLSIRQ
jgi:hypothetical protein